MCPYKIATGWNAPREKVRCQCGIDIESNDQGNNTLWSALQISVIMIMIMIINIIIIITRARAIYLNTTLAVWSIFIQNNGK